MFYILITPKMQEEQNSYFLYGLLLFILCVVVYLSKRRMLLAERVSRVRNRTPQQVPTDKIIIAIEPNQVLFKTSNRGGTGWMEVIEYGGSWQGSWEWIARCFRKRVYFQFRYSKKDMVSFLQGLSQNGKIQLYLYTALPLEVAEFILRRGDILQYFPERFRHSCSGAVYGVKHAVEVDANTARVIILTGSRRDHEQEDGKYFLVMRRKEHNLGRTMRELNRLVNNNENVDELHNQLGMLKVNFESESESIA